MYQWLSLVSKDKQQYPWASKLAWDFTTQSIVRELISSKSETPTNGDEAVTVTYYFKVEPGDLILAGGSMPKPFKKHLFIVDQNNDLVRIKRINVEKIGLYLSGTMGAQVILSYDQLEILPEGLVWFGKVNPINYWDVFRDEALQHGHSRQAILAAITYLKRKAKVQKPNGLRCYPSGLWHVSEEEYRICCWYVDYPSVEFPNVVYNHCCSKIHVANLFGVQKADLSAVVKTLKKFYNENELEFVSLRRFFS